MEFHMPYECAYTGRRTRIGRQCTYRGKAKYLGGVGIKITGRSARKFKPNLQKVRVVIDGKPQRVWASAKAIRSGLVSKRLKRSQTYKHTKVEA
jgi:large subunit ribosomal protein L28